MYRGLIVYEWSHRGLMEQRGAMRYALIVDVGEHSVDYSVPSRND